MIKITDQAGTLVGTADYLPFGLDDVIMKNIGNNLRFPGQYYDSETGLHYTGTGIMIRVRGGI